MEFLVSSSPGLNNVRRYSHTTMGYRSLNVRFLNVRYLISMPERTLRFTAANVGGFIYEASLLLLPGWLRRTRLYTAIVGGALRITIELVGGARGILPPNDIDAQELAVRKAAGTGIEFAGLLTIGWSPLWLFAVTADVTGGTRTYLRALVSELRQDGLLPEDADVDSVEELLDTLENTSGLAAESLDVPPLNVGDMRQTWQDLRLNASNLPDAGRLASIYTSMQHVAEQEESSLPSLSGSIGSAAARAGVQTGQTHIFDFYVDSLRTIDDEGLVNYARRETLPYRVVAAGHFDPNRMTHTERLIRRLFR